MATTPNTTFVAGAVLTAAQQNNFPRGLITQATSTTSYTLTTSTAIATGMTVTWTAEANRLYRISYREPSAETSTVSGSTTTMSLRLTNAAGVLLNASFIGTPAAAKLQCGMETDYIYTPAAGSVTVVGCGSTSSTTGTPVFTRNALYGARITVEDIGGA